MAKYKATIPFTDVALGISPKKGEIVDSGSDEAVQAKYTALVSAGYLVAADITVTENDTYDVTEKAECTVAVPEPTGTLEITENGTYDVAAKASVDVSCPVPSGSLEITENGTYDVTDKASVIVSIPAPTTET